ncbi:MAG: hypothetical protein C5B50_02165 [Verrucomicrobia bacterium]|nr:MAG: hypothetical protein C5B50_02165 [Verrucomicrobiota bacterium]
MKKLHHIWTLSTHHCVLLTVLLLGRCTAPAHPYATHVSTNGAGGVAFILNENATDVTVVFDGGGPGKTNDLGALSKGTQTFALGAHTSFAIIVNNVGSGTASQISVTNGPNANNPLYYFGPRGVAVNRNPQNGTNFGRIYVSNANAGTGNGRTTGRGLYVINADATDALGFGNTAQLAGMSIGGSTTYSPWKLSVGPDDMLYVGDGNGPGNNASPLGYGVWMVKPDLSTSAALFPQSTRTPWDFSSAGGVISKPVVSGSYAAGSLVLTLISTDWTNAPSGFNNVLQFNIGSSALPWPANTPGTILVPPASGIAATGPEVIMDMDIAPDGKIFTLQNSVQAGGPTDPFIRVLSPDGSTLLWDSWNNANPAANGNADPYNFEYSIAISPDDQFMATLITSERIAITPLASGVPNYVTNNLSRLPANNPIVPAGASGTARQIAFDAADNVYEVSGGSDQLRIFSLGLTTTCVTSNDWTGTNGSFAFILPSTTISVSATAPNASQNGPTPGVFTVTRTGQTSALTVNFALSGTATNGTYTVSAPGSTGSGPGPGTITFAAGATSTNISIVPVNDGKARPSQTVVLTLTSGAGYNLGAQITDTVTIQNTNTPQIFLSGGATSMYKSFSNDFASFILTRWGNTNANLTVSTITYGGTAIPGTDFVTTNNIPLPPGTTTATATVSPLDPTSSYTGNKTIVVGETAGSGYIVGGNNVTLTIIDNATPPATSLYSNPLTDAGDAMNWGLTWANRDLQVIGYDGVVDFGYDLTSTGPNGSTPLPPSGATTGLHVTYNKTALCSGAVNLYLTNQTFSGDYAVRFNMYLVKGSSLTLATEGAMFGINHSGVQTNWWLTETLKSSTNIYPNGWNCDGVWCWISSDPGGAGFGDDVFITGLPAGQATKTLWWKKLLTQTYPTFANVFKAPAVFSVTDANLVPVSGVPANASSVDVPTLGSWCDVEMKQVQNQVTFSIDKIAMFTYPNTNAQFSSGMIMLGYEDPFSSTGQPDGAVYYSNLRVVRITPPIFTQWSASGGNVIFNFVTSDGDDTTASFALQSSAAVNPQAWSDVSPAATFTQLSTGAFQVSYPQNGPIRLYRLRHK